MAKQADARSMQPNLETDAMGIPAAAQWVQALAGESGRRLKNTLLSLDLSALARYPLPKSGGLPFGREFSVLARRVRGRTIQLESSGLARVYSALANPRHKFLYRAFTLGDSLARGDWTEILGEEEVSLWKRQGLLITGGDGLRAAFRIVVFDGLCLVADAFAHQARFADRVHIGKDTFTLAECLPDVGARAGRHLDVGTGSGALLLARAGIFSESIGVDINRRAVDVARFNVMLNGRSCEVVSGDVFELGSIGRFDLVTWNLPFHFMPPEERAENVDGDGGHMGIGLTLRFIDRMPKLLAESGSAWLLTSSPTLSDGTKVLVQAMQERASRLRLDVRVSSIRALWSPSRRRFHRAHRIERIDNVVLSVRHGSGRVECVSTPLLQRMMDRVRGIRYGAKP